MKKIILIILVCISINACVSKEDVLFQKAKNAQAENEYKIAFEFYDEFIKTYPQSNKIKEVNELRAVNMEKHNAFVDQLAIINKFSNAREYEQALAHIMSLQKQVLGKNYQNHLLELQKDILKEKNKNRLGGGYQNAKWGMSPLEVKQALGLQVIKSSGNTLNFQQNMNKGVDCYYNNNQLYKVEYNPTINSSRDLDIFYQSLVRKYGTPLEKPNMYYGSTSFRIPIKYYEWTDDYTQIIFTYWIVDEGPAIMSWSSAMVTYLDRNKEQSVRQAEEKANKQKEAEDTERRLQRYSEGI